MGMKSKDGAYLFSLFINKTFENIEIDVYGYNSYLKCLDRFSWVFISEVHMHHSPTKSS